MANRAISSILGTFWFLFLNPSLFGCLTITYWVALCAMHIYWVPTACWRCTSQWQRAWPDPHRACISVGADKSSQTKHMMGDELRKQMDGGLS